MTVLELEVEAVGPKARVCLRPVGQGGPVHYVDVDLTELQRAVRCELEAAVPPVDAVETGLIAAERHIGRQLAELIDPAVRHRWSGMADGVLAVLSRGNAVEALPWELLRSTEKVLADELEGRHTVVRVCPEPGMPFPDSQPILEVALWCPDPDDPTCAVVAADLERTLVRLGISVVDRRAPIPRNHVRVVHVVAHGTQDSGLFGVVGSDTERGVESMLASLRPTPGQDGLVAVVLDICGSGSAWRPLEDRLPAALLRTGCPAVRCPDQALSAAMATVANDAFYNALARECSLVQATAEARLEVCGEGLGRPDSRWYRIQLYVGDHSAPNLERTVLRAISADDLWPGASPLLRRVLVRAARLAMERQQASIDSISLAIALVQTRASGLGRLYSTLRSYRDREESYPYWQVRSELSRVEALAPRVRRWSEVLGADATPAQLADRLLADAEQPLAVRYLQSISAANSQETIDIESTAPVCPPHAGRPVLEVLGGPEDGRILMPHTGDHLGRASDEARAEHQLYVGTVGCDGRVSRTHLHIVDWQSWCSPDSHFVGTLELKGKPTLRVISPRTREPGYVEHGESFQVGPGDVLALTDATWLRVWVMPETM